MNIARIRNMAANTDMSTDALRYFIYECHGECEYLDFKETLDLSTDETCAGFAKDVLGIRNVGGGYLVVGVKDKTWSPVGLSSHLPYDSKQLREKVRKALGLEIEIDIVAHVLDIEGISKEFAIILVRSTSNRKKLRSPLISKRDFQHKQNWGIRQGDIFIRKGDSTKRLTDQSELESLLGILEDRFQQDELEHETALPSPFAVDSGLYRLLPSEFATFVGREALRRQLQEAIESDPRIWIVNLYGPGGVGKSALATWLAYDSWRRKQPFEAILQLSAKNLELVGQGIHRLRPTLFSFEDFLDRILRLFEHDEYCTDHLDRQKEVVIDLLRSFRTLLILDNMETMTDGRVMDFVKSLPQDNRSKVLITSRRRTSGWEYPIQVTELNEQEISLFITAHAAQTGLELPIDSVTFAKKIAELSGGLPLAIQWLLGEYARTKDSSRIINRVFEQDSPLLEFSFRNSWDVLDHRAQQALAVRTIFEESPTAHEWRTALDWSVEEMERAIDSLTETTFISSHVEQKTGTVVYSALPITMTFARLELNKMGSLEAQARIRYQTFRNTMELAAVETTQYGQTFEQFEAKTDTQKRAIILSRMADGQARDLRFKDAEQLYKQALEIEPRSVYSLVHYGLFKADLENFGEAIELLQRATKHCTQRSGFFVYYNLGMTYDRTHDRTKKIEYLRKALNYDPKHTVARHALGVALSQNGMHDEAIAIFDAIINEELSRPDSPSISLSYAYNSKITALDRSHRGNEARKVQEEAINNLSKFPHLERHAQRIREI